MDELTTFSTVDDYSDVSVLSIILYMCCLSVCLLGCLSSFLFLRVRACFLALCQCLFCWHVGVQTTGADVLLSCDSFCCR